jgi:hypothetical protein
MTSAAGLVAMRGSARARKREQAVDDGGAYAAESVKVQRRKLRVEIANLQA